jgi:hypothetical protein
MCVGEYARARQALAASLAGARSRKDKQETMLALASLRELDRRTGQATSAADLAELDSLLARFSIRALPPIPAPA